MAVIDNSFLAVLHVVEPPMSLQEAVLEKLEGETDITTDQELKL